MHNDNDLKEFLSDPDNVEDFLKVGMTISLGFSLTEDGEWVKLDS